MRAWYFHTYLAWLPALIPMRTSTLAGPLAKTKQEGPIHIGSVCHIATKTFVMPFKNGWPFHCSWCCWPFYDFAQYHYSSKKRDKDIHICYKIFQFVNNKKWGSKTKKELILLTLNTSKISKKSIIPVTRSAPMLLLGILMGKCLWPPRTVSKVGISQRKLDFRKDQISKDMKAVLTMLNLVPPNC